MAANYGSGPYGDGPYGMAINALGAGARKMNLGSLITESQRLAARVDSTFDDRTKQWINEAQEAWALADPWGQLTHEETVDADGTKDLYLPGYMRKIIWIGDSDNKRQIDRVESWDRRDPSQFFGRTSGSVVWWRELGTEPVAAQPAAATQVFFDPESGENVVCYVSGVAQDTGSSGNALATFFKSEHVTCQSGAESSSAGFYVKVLSLGKGALTTDDVLVSYTSGGASKARIDRNQYRSEYRHVELLRIPTAGTTLHVRFILRLPDLTDNNQIVPPGVSVEYLKWYAASNIHKAMNQNQEAALALAKANQHLQARGKYENTFGDQDYSSLPDYEYWGNEDQYGW